MDGQKCKGTAKTGNPCAMDPVVGADYCHFHIPPMVLKSINEQKLRGELTNQAVSSGMSVRDFKGDKIEYALLVRELVHRNSILLRDVWEVIEEVQATRSAEALAEHWQVLNRWETTTKTIWNLIQTAAQLDPSTPDDDHLALGTAGVERLLAAIEGAVAPGVPCDCCGGSGRQAVGQLP